MSSYSIINRKVDGLDNNEKQKIKKTERAKEAGAGAGLLAKGKAAGANFALSFLDTNLLNYMFAVTIDGVLAGAFLECSGVSAKRKIEVKFHEGGWYKPHLLPGALEFDNITLKRGLTNSTVLLDWFLTGQFTGMVKRHNVTISIHHYAVVPPQPILFWTLENAVPVSYKIGDMNSASSTVMVETLELAYEGLQLDQEIDAMGVAMDAGRIGLNMAKNSNAASVVRAEANKAKDAAVEAAKDKLNQIRSSI